MRKGVAALFFNNVMIATRMHPLQEVNMKVKVSGRKKITQNHHSLVLCCISRRKLGEDGEMLERECYCIYAALPFDFGKVSHFK